MSRLIWISLGSVVTVRFLFAQILTWARWLCASNWHLNGFIWWHLRWLQPYFLRSLWARGESRIQLQKTCFIDFSFGVAAQLRVGVRERACPSPLSLRPGKAFILLLTNSGSVRGHCCVHVCYALGNLLGVLSCQRYEHCGCLLFIGSFLNDRREKLSQVMVDISTHFREVFDSLMHVGEILLLFW